MEAATISTRETVMAHVWDRFVGYFANNEWGRAEGCFGYYCRLEEMTDEEYDTATHCEKGDCYCTE
jgi:hypothetical protein